MIYIYKNLLKVIKESRKKIEGRIKVLEIAWLRDAGSSFLSFRQAPLLLLNAGGDF